MLAHSVPFPVPVGDRVVVPELIQDEEREPGQSFESTTVIMLPTAGATDTTPEEEDLSARLSIKSHAQTGMDTDTYKLTPSLTPDVPSTSTRKSPQKEPESAVVMEGEGNEGVEDGKGNDTLFRGYCGHG